MQYYDEVQEVNERRKRRLLAYYEYIDARTRNQMAEVVHKLTRGCKASGKDGNGLHAPGVGHIKVFDDGTMMVVFWDGD